MAGTNDDYTDKAMRDHVKTYNGVLSMFKMLIVLVIVVLLLLVVIHNA